MKILCGTDIIEIDRIKKSIERSGKTFLKLIYTPNEIKYCEGTRNAKYYHYAGRFAAKEAIYKAVSGLLEHRYDISWQNAEIINDEWGNPKIKFIDVDIKGIESIDISISHCKSYAVATVILVVNS